jgi:hypothetical protein
LEITVREGILSARNPLTFPYQFLHRGYIRARLASTTTTLLIVAPIPSIVPHAFDESSLRNLRKLAQDEHA